MADDRPLTCDDIARALDGDDESLRELVRHLERAVQPRIACVLRNSSAARDRGARQELLDFVQDEFCDLWANEARILRRFDQSCGSFAGYFGTIAHYHAIRRLETKRRSPFTITPCDNEIISAMCGEVSFESQFAASDYLSRLIPLVEAELSEQQHLVFHHMFLEQRTPREVADEIGTTPHSVSSQATRIRNVIKRARERLDRERS